VLSLQGAFARHEQVLGDLGAGVCEVRAPRDLADLDGLVIPGGESTTMSLLLESTGLLEPLRARLACGLPALGTCAGMILLARELLDGRPDQHTLGALDIDVRRNAFGRQVDSFETDLSVVGLDGPPLHAVFIRAPVVERAGPEVEVLAEVEGQPVLCRQGAVMAAAFHPELVDDARLHELFLSAIESVER
jgi:pyridoxal 5'-phosphate synthase pdxT subunit